MINKINRVILCIIDDLRSEHLFKFVDRGLLPNIKSIMEKGIYSKNCVTDFPSITYPTQVSMITGTYTGDYRKELCHGVPLTNWMGRNTIYPFLRSYLAKDMQIYKLNEDMGNNCQSILEMVGDGNTASIVQFISKGAKYIFPERKTKLAMYYLILTHLRNRKQLMIRANSIIVQKLLDNYKNPKKFFNVKEPPVASLLCFISSDLLMHVYGFDSQIYKLNLLHIDKVIGYLIKILDKLGYLDDTMIAITSDHGNYKASKVGDLSNFFKVNELTHYHPRKNRKGNMDLAEYGGVGFFNFKGNV
ncbi:MAG: alkaline phosphatase family protein, partial [Promethearchaeota archaeon]